MTFASLSAEESEVVRRAMEATFRYLDFDFRARLGIDEENMRALLAAWPNIDDNDESSDAYLAINNSLNDLLNGVGISDEEATSLTGADTAEMRRIYNKWALCRGRTSTGLR